LFSKAELALARGRQVDVSWGGQQVRSYVLSPYRLVKDHRVGALLKAHISSGGSSSGGGSSGGSRSGGSSGGGNSDGGEDGSGGALGAVTDNAVEELLDGGLPLDGLLSDVLQAHAAVLPD
jgi:hypothetical protein